MCYLKTHDLVSRILTSSSFMEHKASNNLSKIENFDAKNFDIVINCSNNLYFKKIFKKFIKRMNNNSIIYDFWSVINKSSKILNYKKSIFLFNYGSETNII